MTEAEAIREALAKADEAHRAAFFAYQPIADAHLAGTATDAEFFASRDALNAALAAWEVAFAAVAALPDEPEVEAAEDDGQLDLFTA